MLCARGWSIGGAWALVGWVGCGGPEAPPASGLPPTHPTATTATAPETGDTARSGDTGDSVETGESDTDPGPPPVVEVVPGSTVKVCQLTGDEDRQLGAPTPTLTSSRYGLWGTDLGSSFVHDGKRWFLFGDSIPTAGGQGNPECGDAIAWTEDTDVSDCLDLDFVVGDGGTYRSPSIPGVELGCFEVPLDGVSAGGAMYVWFSTDTMTRSVLAASTDGARTFALVHETSDLHFVNVSAETTPDGDGYPEGEGERLVLFGSGAYRASDVYLATAPLAGIADRGALRFHAGTDAAGAPLWTDDEAGAAPIVEHPCVGELSAHYEAGLDRWVLLYNCDDPRGIVLRSAPAPWGPWSEPAVIFDPWADGGYCGFMHVAWHFDVCDAVHDPGREYEWGGEYGAYALGGLSTTREGGGIAMAFVMSTWNPYAVVLLRSELRFPP